VTERDPEQADERLLEHEYDGIKEYDNPLPGWWKAIFLATIVFAAVYGIYYHLGGPGLSELEEYESEMAAFYEAQAKSGKAIQVTEEMILMLGKSGLERAKGTYVAKCVQCHGSLGEGGIGPNLKDRFWIHGGKPLEVWRTVNEGVPAKGMLAWGKQLKADEVAALAAYVLSLEGPNPPNAKAPEGKER
jgi:cytochrome c oxidase cbb3-type subunit 3